jgi:hypothetical protein
MSNKSAAAVTATVEPAKKLVGFHHSYSERSYTYSFCNVQVRQQTAAHRYSFMLKMTASSTKRQATEAF